QLLQLVEDLPHPDDPDAAAGRVEDRVRHLPAELLDDLEAHRLLALDAVGLAAGASMEPAVALGGLGHDAEHVADGAVDPVHVGAVREAALPAELGALDWERRVHLAAGAGAVRGPGVAAAPDGGLGEPGHA